MKAKSMLARGLVSSFALALVATAIAPPRPAVAQFWPGSGEYRRPYSYQRAPDGYGRDRPYRRESKREPAGQSRNAEGAPMLAIVALGEQQVTIYNAHGKMLQSPVSTGARGLETPAGIYSVVQKEEFHQSNVYEDGNMPFMERITWTGIALHGGVLPGYPASHGCIRMPEQFAQSLYGLTSVGMRVVVVRDDIAPAEISHPALFTPAASGSMASTTAQLEMLKAQAAAKSAEAVAASKRAAAARQVAAKKAAEAASASRNLRAAESATARSEETLKAAVRAGEAANAGSISAPSVRQAKLAKERAANRLAQAQAQLEADKEKVEFKDKDEAKVAQGQAELKTAEEKLTAKFDEARTQLELAKQKAAAQLAEVQARLAAAKTQAQARADEAALAETEGKSAEAARELAAEAFSEASQKLFPISVFISRKTQRLYVRQNYVPVYEAPVTIRDPDTPIGSYVFTALGPDTNGAMRWNVVSMYKGSGSESPPAAEKHKSDHRSAQIARADVVGAKAALSRIVMPKDVVERFSDVVLPGASLIISDEGASIETGKDTDFVVLMSGEPQGGIKTRHVAQSRYRRDEDDD